MNVEIIFVFLISYLIGAIPFAYLLVRYFAKIEISKTGSGNVGARNSYDVTGKKWLGITVMALDAFKGAFVMVLIDYLFPQPAFDFYLLIGGISVILGHNFNIFLNLKGGKGLATAAGISLVTSPVALFIWGILYIASRKVIRDDVHIGNIVATLMMPVLMLAIPEDMFRNFFIIKMNVRFYLLMFSGLSILIMIKHINDLKRIIKG